MIKRWWSINILSHICSCCIIILLRGPTYKIARFQAKLGPSVAITTTEKIVGLKIFVKRYFWSKSIFGQRKFWSKRFSPLKKIFDQFYFGLKYFLSNNISGKKIGKKALLPSLVKQILFVGAMKSKHVHASPD